MKTKILILILSFLACNLLAQMPNYFENNPEWRQSSSCADGLPCVEKQDFVYYINGDSTVDGITYKKVYKHGLLSHQWFDSPPVPDYCETTSTFNIFDCLLRQEEYKIYIRKWGDPETLLYDFDLNVGDTLPITYIQWNEDIVVLSIDSISVGDSYRKIFNLSDQSSPQLIEGIGHDGGFLEPFPPILECGHFLLCYALNGTTYYPNYNDPCDLTVSIKPSVKTSSIKAYPNPAKNTVTIQFDKPEIIKSAIAININGQSFDLNFKQKNENSIIVDLSQLSKGLYMIQLTTKEKSTLNLKVLRE
ncbi:MAG: hypothetical protein C0595_08420 [Marinilabiliales bacterium]|nr:MAG: hypothetical protein C0595_08420 [Marinilabiliales bacterium]